MTKIRLPKEVSWGMVVFVLLNIPFFLYQLDIHIESLFFNPNNPYPWNLRSKYPWNVLYYFGSYPAALTAIAALFLAVMSFIRPNYARYRKQALFLVTVLVVGPGLLVNAVLKDHWGRPRPREIECFGGQKEFYQVLEPAFDQKGKSFPCGHCSMGFYFFALFFLFKERKKWLARVMLGWALLFGLGIGVARMGQGGHFPSDVLWSGGVVYFVSAFLYYRIFRLHEQSEPEVVSNMQTKGVHRTYITIGLGTILSIAIVLGVLVATPLVLEKQLDLTSVHRLQLSGEQGDVVVKTEGEKDRGMVIHTEGFGFPGNELEIEQKKTPTGTAYSYRISGWHTEAKSNILINQKLSALDLRIEDSHILIDSSAVLDTLTIYNKRGSITLRLPDLRKDTIYCRIQAPGRKIKFENLKDVNRIKILNNAWSIDANMIKNNTLEAKLPKTVQFLLTY
ncbi:MAG: hypothetical protein Kow00108_04970 [Calditrichia bacterium]